MLYKITSIQTAASVKSIEPFYISHTLWNSKESPISFGRIGYIPNKTLIVQLVCNQTNPLRVHHGINSPVYKDSALEFFLQAELGNPNYLNFELNANGALLLQWGGKLPTRTYLSDEQIKACLVQAEIKEQCWSITLNIPLRFLHNFYPDLMLEKGHPFRFNLYKICETSAFEHYISLTSIPTATPNFHQPNYFADGILD